jgi:predicted secreted Zn-dependent protease
MGPVWPVWMVIVLAMVAANLPFLNERLMVVGPRRAPAKALGWRALELLLWYLVVGAVGLALEQYLGQNYPQRWEFYAVTAALFLTLAFPGFVFRYLLKRS